MPDRDAGVGVVGRRDLLGPHPDLDSMRRSPRFVFRSESYTGRRRHEGRADSCYGEV